MLVEYPCKVTSSMCMKHQSLRCIRLCQNVCRKNTCPKQYDESKKLNLTEETPTTGEKPDQFSLCVKTHFYITKKQLLS